MKAAVLITFTDCGNKVDSLVACGYDVETRQYDKLTNYGHAALVDDVRHNIKPDFIVLIGGVPSTTHNVPSYDIMRQFRKIAPFIHMCDDAGDSPWWPYLEAFDREECFDVQVAIDGSQSPINKFHNGIVLLTPIDPRPFVPKPWNERGVTIGMMGGGIGHMGRQSTVQGLIDKGVLDFRIGNYFVRPYKEYANFLCSCKSVLNHPMTGTGHFWHVKGRVIETGFAGACLFERKGSPTANWFLPGVEYVEYDGDNPEAVISVMNAMGDEELRQMAERFHTRVVRNHHPKVFWDAVLAKAGFKS